MNLENPVSLGAAHTKITQDVREYAAQKETDEKRRGRGDEGEGGGVCCCGYTGLPSVEN